MPATIESCQPRYATARSPERKTLARAAVRLARAMGVELMPWQRMVLETALEVDERGRLDETLVLCLGEFGRTPKINANAGRDHWGPCSTTFVAGGGLRTGQVIGASDKIGAYPTTEPIGPVDIHATMYHALGIDPLAGRTRSAHARDAQVPAPCA